MLTQYRVVCVNECRFSDVFFLLVGLKLFHVKPKFLDSELHKAVYHLDCIIYLFVYVMLLSQQWSP
jgi:hypothetical protein